MRKRNCIAIVLFFVVFAAAGCAQSKQLIEMGPTIVDMPPLDVIAEAKKGDPIIAKGKSYINDIMVLHNEVSWGDGFFIEKVTISPGTLVARAFDNKWVYYYSDHIAKTGLGMKLPPIKGGLKVSKTDPDNVVMFVEYDVAGKPKPEPDIELMTVDDEDKPTSKKELVYEGRTGDVIKLTYNETVTVRRKETRSERLEFDLKEGNIIKFKGARIEVIKASEDLIKYKVLKGFSERK